MQLCSPCAVLLARESVGVTAQSLKDSKQKVLIDFVECGAVTVYVHWVLKSFFVEAAVYFSRDFDRTSGLAEWRAVNSLPHFFQRRRLIHWMGYV